MLETEELNINGPIAKRMKMDGQKGRGGRRKCRLPLRSRVKM
jgi:hypothetical protein